MAKKKADLAEITDRQIKNLGKRLKELRVKKGFSNGDFFAYEHNIARAQYGRYERGEDIRFSSLIKLLEIHKISLKEFFGEGFN